MNLSLNYFKSALTLLLVVITKFSAAQVNFYKKESFSDFYKRDTIKEKPDRSDFSINLSVSVLPPAKITRDEGNYRLQSRLQSAYEVGFNYIFNASKTFSFKTGVTAVLGRWNFFSNIPDEDIPGYSSAYGASLISSKDVWGAVKLPLIAEKSFKTNKFGLISANVGLGLRYAGFNSDLRFWTALIDSTNQVVRIFDSDFSMNNRNKMWLSILAGMSKSIRLKNDNLLSLGIQADISRTNFLIGSYEITMPGQPVTSGTYSINGSSIGISVAYIFTGTNKRLARKYVK